MREAGAADKKAQARLPSLPCGVKRSRRRFAMGNTVGERSVSFLSFKL
jgi:hypothetical protein